MPLDDAELDREMAKLGLRRPTLEELPDWEYDHVWVNAIQEIGSRCPAPPGKSGLVEMQRWFIKFRKAAETDQRVARLVRQLGVER